MRFRPLRPASRPDATPVAVAEPPERMRAAVIDATGGTEALHEATVAVPTPILSELLVRVVAAGVNPIDAKTRAGTGVSGSDRPITPRRSASTSAGSSCAAPYESHPLPPGHPRVRHGPFPRSGGSYAEYAVVPSLSVARKPDVAFARRGCGRAAGRPDRVGTGRRDRARPRRAADADPRRQRRRGSLRRAVRRVLRRTCDRDRLEPQRGVAARTRSISRHRSLHDPVRGCHRRRRRRDRPGRQRA